MINCKCRKENIKYEASIRKKVEKRIEVTYEEKDK